MDLLYTERLNRQATSPVDGGDSYMVNDQIRYPTWLGPNRTSDEPHWIPEPASSLARLHEAEVKWFRYGSASIGAEPDDQF